MALSTESGKCACMLSKGTFGGGGLGSRDGWGKKVKFFNDLNSSCIIQEIGVSYV